MGHGLSCFDPWSVGSAAFGPVVGQNIIAGVGGGGDAPLMAARKRREKEEGAGVPVSPGGYTPVTSFPLIKSYPLKFPPPPNSTMSWDPSLQY